jgi:hypothetical protein
MFRKKLVGDFQDEAPTCVIDSCVKRSILLHNIRLQVGRDFLDRAPGVRSDGHTGKTITDCGILCYSQVMEKRLREPEHEGPIWKHPYFLYVILTVMLFVFLVAAGALAWKSGWLPNQSA